MAIEIIPKKEQERPSSMKAFFYYFGKTLLIVSIVLSLFFLFFQWRFTQEIKAIDQSISQRKTADIVSLEKAIKSYSEKTKDFSILFQEKKSLMSFFQVLEDAIHPDVVLTEIKVTKEENEALISAKAKDMTAFGQQIDLFRGKTGKTISVFDLVNFNRGEGSEIFFSARIEIIIGDIVCVSENSDSIELSFSYNNAGAVYLFDKEKMIAGPLASGSSFTYQGLTPRTTYEFHLRNGTSSSLAPFSSEFCRTKN
jgi:hypothetical protein